jgi:hypothetical protein
MFEVKILIVLLSVVSITTGNNLELKEKNGRHLQILSFRGGGICFLNKNAPFYELHI